MKKITTDENKANNPFQWMAEYIFRINYSKKENLSILRGI